MLKKTKVRLFSAAIAIAASLGGVSYTQAQQDNFERQQQMLSVLRSGFDTARRHGRRVAHGVLLGSVRVCPDVLHRDVAACFSPPIAAPAPWQRQR